MAFTERELSYCIVGLIILALCGVYYYIWIILMPKWGQYEIVEETVESSDGAKYNKLTRVYKLERDGGTRNEEANPLLRS